MYSERRAKLDLGAMKAATLFSGIGAPECSMPGWDWRWSADIDDFANVVRAHHWPDVPNLGDVGKVDAGQIEPVDAIVFGSPCQSFSVAGKRLGLADARGNLALVALALVERLRPSWFVFENVPGLLSSDDGRDFAAFLGTVRECGYSGAYRVLDAQYFGVPQRRRRVFFVGHLGDDWRPSAAVLFEPESLRGNPAPRREAREDVAPSFRAQPQSSHHADSEAFVAFNLRGREGGSMPECDDIASIRAASGGSSRSYVADSMVRRLTPTECERLQGFSDGFTNIPWRGKQAPDGRRYKALGNSMAVPVLRWILTRLENQHQRHTAARQ